jgi:hypothetical protein
VQTSNSLTRVYGPPTLTILGTIEALTRGTIDPGDDNDGGGVPPSGGGPIG